MQARGVTGHGIPIAALIIADHLEDVGERVAAGVRFEENGGQIRGFIARHPDFAIVPADEVTSALGDRKPQFDAAIRVSAEGLLMTPRRIGTDGFFVALMRRG